MSKRNNKRGSQPQPVQKNEVNVRVIKGAQNPQAQMINKSLVSNDVSDTKEAELAGIDGVLPQPYPIKELQKLIEMSTILQQCVEAYRRNIVGYGAAPQYLKDDIAKGDETPEMIQEWNRMEDFIGFFSYDQSFEDVWGVAIEDREQTGNGYIEILRDGLNRPVGGDRLDPCSVYVTKLSDFVEVTQNIRGQKVTRRRRFRRYVQRIGGAKVYFKEFGDPRMMNKDTGEYTDGLPEDLQANEVLHLKIGSGAYGVPRWIGQLIHMYGARKAEELNYRYFYQGRHVPMAILLSNAELSDESAQALTEYAQAVEGVEHSHKFLIIEAEGYDTGGAIPDDKKNSKVEIKSLADMLQQDALFLEYDDASRQKVQSSFRLPDIYVGRSKDFNRATADAARNITEEQVFEPERNSLEWLINNKLLLEHEFKETKLVFRKPEISDWDALEKMLRVIIEGGGVAPNDLRDLAGKLLGSNAEPFEGELFDKPKIAWPFIQAQQQAAQQAQSNQQIEKAAKSVSNDLVDLLKDMRDLLEEQYSQLEKVSGNE